MWIGEKPLPSAPGVEQICRGYRTRNLVAIPTELSRLCTVTDFILIFITTNTTTTIIIIIIMKIELN
jgi:hypothetical protein